MPDRRRFRPPRDLPRVCTKIRYADELAAARALEDARYDHRTRRKVEQRYYHCPDCQHWHLTSMKQRPA